MNIKRYLLHIFYPARCPVCNKIINYNDDFCTECRAKITPYTDFHEIENCDCAYSVCCYDENIQPAVFLLKDGICGNSAYAFALGLNKLLTEKNIISKFDIIIPIPMFKTNKRKRGYNQSELIGKELSILSGIKLNSGCLSKIKKTRPQKELNGKERLENLKGVFRADSSQVNGRSILLIDDICTTGSTLKEAAGALKSCGAEYVCALTYCKTL